MTGNFHWLDLNASSHLRADSLLTAPRLPVATQCSYAHAELNDNFITSIVGELFGGTDFS